MSFASVLILAVGLSMDATAVSAARAVGAPPLRFRHVASVALLFGGFQAGMPLLGWIIGREFGAAIAAWDHWLAFALLAGIGAKMLHEAWSGEETQMVAAKADRFGLYVLTVLAIATSVDAFAAGLVLPIMGAPLLLSLATIGLTTAVLSATGLWVGRRLGSAVGRKFDAFGGIVLVLLGTKILLSHLAD